MKLTRTAQIFIGLVVLCVLGYVFKFKYLPSLTAHRAALSHPVAEPGATGPAKNSKRIVIGINDFGGGYPLLLANDGVLPGPGSLFSKAGLEVEIRLIRGAKERLRAFTNGDVHVMLLTVDHLANLVPEFAAKGVELRSFLLIDWSRGNLGIAAKPEFASIESLKTARIATTRNTPTHYLLLSLLAQSGLTPAEIDTAKGNLVFAAKYPQAVELFRQGEVDAVALWEPHLSEVTAGGKGELLVTTDSATHLFPDVLFARKDWLEAHQAELTALAQAYFGAVEQLGRSAEHTIELAATAFQHKPAQIAATLTKIKPATFADNREFFGLDQEGGAYDALYLEAGGLWQKEGVIKQVAAPAQTKWLTVLAALAPQYRAEKAVENFQFTAAPDLAAPALLTKRINLPFASGQSAVDASVRPLLDGLAATLAELQNTYVQIECNTDNVGSRASSTALSRARAEAIVSYLCDQHHLDRARFIAIGHGPDQPLADNRTPEGRALNRRTEFKIFRNRGASASASAPEPIQISAANRPGAPSAPSAPVETSPPSQPVSGEIDRSLIRRVMKRSIVAFRSCYEAGLKIDPKLAGKVTLKFTIADSGAVSASEILDSTLHSPAVASCLGQAVHRMKFPHFAGSPIQIVYPFVFQPDSTP